MSDRDVYRYEMKMGRRVVFIGYAKEMREQGENHVKAGHKFTHINVLPPRVTEKTAKRWMEKRLRTYRKGHSGINPEYNRTDTLKTLRLGGRVMMGGLKPISRFHDSGFDPMCKHCKSIHSPFECNQEECYRCIHPRTDDASSYVEPCRLSDWENHCPFGKAWDNDAPPIEDSEEATQ